MADRFPIEFGDYRLLRKLAQGGMAEIFLAQDRRGNIVAIKRILPHLAHEESFIRMFIDEARIVSHLDHPNVAGVFDQGKHDGYYFIAMEFVQGHSLLSVSERAKSMKMPLPRGLLGYVVAELLAGLGCAHAARDAKGRALGIVHRDVTPQNVLISYDGEVKLIDFGVAKARARLTQTEAGFTKGKLSYMSPEQARGEELDGRSDLFSVGIILHEITTNSRLFNKEGPGGILGAIVNDPIPPPSLKVRDFPRELEGIVMRGLEKDVERRYQSAEEMRDDLLRYARREKPAPGRARLKDLVHDLFGEPDSQKVIDEAQAAAAPTPERVEAHQAMRNVSVRVKGSEVAPAEVPKERFETGATAPREDETRMLRPDYELRPSRIEKRPEITSDGTPILRVPISRADVPIPEPVVSLRLKLARYLVDLVTDLRLSWRTNRRRWILGIAGMVGLVVLLGAVQAGAVGSMVHWMGGAADKVREVKRSAGLSDLDLDAGVRQAVLRLRTDPPGAAIAIDGLGSGSVTPHDLEGLATGRTISLELTLPGYRPSTAQVTLWPNQGVQEHTFSLERQVGSVEVRSDPEGAAIYVDDKRQNEKTPATLTGLAAGAPLNVKVALKGRTSQSQVVVVPDGETRSVYFELPVDERQIPPGSIAVDSSPVSGCPVFIDDTPVGNTPLAGYDVKAGSHSVRVKCENYEQEVRVASVSPGKTSRVSFALSPNVFGYLTVRTIPQSGCEIRVNGRLVPPPVEFLKVVPGSHVVAVRHPGLGRDREMRVDVGANARITRTISLVD